ncbi:MCE family protein [Nocardioides bizhenqiangii]|uniref:MCE family protein n=1 Tax=Nocardioides bizhenqiangii TaxID=3095076 RepID=A0ABZ0ZM85_9ACTN|nr:MULTISPECIES: MCE family protein [unclassified Nocardioides]MDZ5620503.1 MCE family protein [Nocardioides sp. HM23]WQQ24871.1 MCE family protein [Nocardioides sp. HM61]
MTGIRVVAAKVAVFALAAILLLILLVNTMANGVSGDTNEFTAEFADVSGLRVGDDVKAAGVRVGQVTGIEATDEGATVDFVLVDEQKLYDTTKIIMRYQNLLGQRYLQLRQEGARGDELEDGAEIPMAVDSGPPGDRWRTDPGFDLTELLNGFRPLFEILQPSDVNELATSIIKVLQGEGGTIEGLLRQTAELTSFVADRDEVIGEVMTNLTPVLENLAGQGGELRATVVELRDLMTGLARDRKAIGASIDGISQLVGATSDLLRDAKVPMTRTSDRLATVAAMFKESRGDLEDSLEAFGTIFESLGRAGSYENALNIYACTFALALGDELINPAGGHGPWSEVCR